jgi:hypothetical protein
MWKWDDALVVRTDTTREPQSKLLAPWAPKYFCNHNDSLYTTKSRGLYTKNLATTCTYFIMADALKAEGNKLFAEKKFTESM